MPFAPCFVGQGSLTGLVKFHATGRCAAAFRGVWLELKGRLGAQNGPSTNFDIFEIRRNLERLAGYGRSSESLSYAVLRLRRALSSAGSSNALMACCSGLSSPC